MMCTRAREMIEIVPSTRAAPRQPFAHRCATKFQRCEVLLRPAERLARSRITDAEGAVVGFVM